MYRVISEREGIRENSILLDIDKLYTEEGFKDFLVEYLENQMGNIREKFYYTLP